MLYNVNCMQNNKSIIITVAVLAVLLIVVIALVLTRSDNEVELAGNNDQVSNDVAGDESNLIIVNDQLPGNVVFYSNLNLAEDGFVVVRDEIDGRPGDVVGVKVVEAGEGLTGEVELDEPTVEGSRYYVELYVDTNENGVFDADEDDPVVTASGNNVRVRITATEDLPELKG